MNKENRPAADLFPEDDEGLPELPLGGLTPNVDLTIASGDVPTTMTAQPAAESEWWPRSPWFDVRGFNQMRVIVDDVYVAGFDTARIVAKYKAKVAYALATPGIASAEIAARIGTVGPKRSPWITLVLAAIGDRLWHALAVGGDGIVSPEVGGVHLQFRSCATPACGLSGIERHGDDLSGYADFAEWVAFAESGTWFYNPRYSGDGAGGEAASFDPILTFNCNPVIVGTYQNSPRLTGPGFWTDFALPDDSVRERFDDVWTRLRFKVEEGWDATGSSFQEGLQLSDLSTNLTSTSAGVFVRGGRLLLDTQRNTGAGTTATDDMGAASLVIGSAGFLELIIHAKRLSSTSHQIDVYLGDACQADIPLLFGKTLATTHATAKWEAWDKFNYPFDAFPSTPKRVWWATAEYVNGADSANPFGVA